MNRFQYWFSGTKSRRRRLLETLSHDTALNTILERLHPLNIRIIFRFFGQHGTYTPQAVTMSEPLTSKRTQKAMQDALSMLKTPIVLAHRFGFSANAHVLIHELIHLDQDRRGMFFTPLVVKNQPVIMPDQDSAIRIRLFCEVMAEVEALRASWRLKESGYDTPWRGALKSPDWHSLAKAYEHDLKIKHIPEAKATQTIIANWMALPTRAYYESRATLDHQTFIEKLSSIPEFCSVSCADIIERLPSDLQDTYSAVEEYVQTDKGSGTKSKQKKTLDDFTQGSPLYLKDQK